MKPVNKAIKKYPLDIKRFQGNYVDGVFVKIPIAELNVLAHIQPFNGNSQESNTNGKWQRSVIKVFSEDEIIVADEFDYQKKHYVVKSVANYALGAIPHFEAIAHEAEEEQEGNR